MTTAHFLRMFRSEYGIVVIMKNVAMYQFLQIIFGFLYNVGRHEKWTYDDLSGKTIRIHSKNL